MNTNIKNHSEDAEYGVDSRYKSLAEQKSEATALMETRLMRMKKNPAEQIIKAKLLQLNLKMEQYINKPICDNNNYFSEFLKFYIDTIYSKRNVFARDIDMAPVSLSQILNNHREPNEEFFLKLILHSEKAYLNVCEFHKDIWYQVYYQEKICETMSNQERWRPKIERQVKLSETI